MAKRELLVARIISSCVVCKLRTSDGRIKPFLLKTPLRYHRLVAQQVYEDAIEKAYLEGLYTEQSLMNHLITEGIWNQDSDKKIKDLNKNIEELKVQLYQLIFRSNERATVREMLSVTKRELESLFNIKASYAHLTCEGAASIARARYLVGASLHHLDGTAVFDMETFWEQQSSMLDYAYVAFQKQTIREPEYRELARTEPWRSTWNCRKSEASVFGVPACDLTDEQKNIVSWSIAYDNIHEHPECPTEVVIEDDDSLDGWMILQRRNREVRLEEDRLKTVINNDKIRESEEVFVVVNTADDAKKINSFNTYDATRVKRQREAVIKQRGVAKDADFADRQQQIRREINAGFTQATKG